MSSEAPREITRPLSKLDIPIEDDLNNYLQSIGYSNEKLTEVLLVLIIRNDDFSAMGGERIRKHRTQKIINRTIDSGRLIAIKNCCRKGMCNKS